MFHIRPYGWPPQPFTICSSPGKSGQHALTNNGALELSKYSAHLEHGFPGGRGRVDALLMEVQIDPECVDLREKGQQVLQGSSEGMIS